MYIKKLITKKNGIWFFLLFCLAVSFFIYFTKTIIYEHNVNIIKLFTEKQIKQQELIFDTFFTSVNADQKIENYIQLIKKNKDFADNSSISVYRIVNNDKKLIGTSSNNQNLMPINDSDFWHQINLKTQKGNFNLENRNGGTIYISWQYFSEYNIIISVKSLLKTDVSDTCKQLIFIIIPLLFILLIIGFWLIVKILRPIFANMDVEIEKLKDYKKLQKERETFFQTVVNTGQSLIWTSGIDKKCNYFNKPWLDFTGHTLEQELGNGWAKSIHPNDINYCMETYQRSFDKQEIFSMDYRIKHNSGSYRWIRDKGTPHYDSKGNFLGYVGHCIDITELKENEKRLQQIATMYKMLFNEMKEGFALHEMIYDENGTPCDYRFISVNAAFEQMTGLKSYEIQQKTVLEILPETEKYWIKQYGQVVIAGEPLSFESYSKELKKIYYVTAYRPHKDHFAVIFTDVTEQRLTEKIIRKYNSRLTFAMETAKMAWWEIDVKTGNVIFEKNIIEKLGFDSSEIDTLLKFRSLIHPEEAKMVNESFTKYLESKKTKFEIEYRLKTKTGEYIWFYDKGSIVKYDENKKPIKILGVIVDISERKKTETILKETKDKYFKVFNQAQVLIMISDFLTGEIIEINEYALKKISCKKEEIIGKSAMELGWIDKVSSDKMLTLISQNRQIEGFEMKFKTKSGDEIYGIIYGNKILIDGKDCFLTIGSDITERKKSEEIIKNKSALLEAQLNSTGDGILVVNKLGKKVLQNQKTIDIWKIPRHIADNPDDDQQVDHVVKMTKNPQQFLDKIIYLYDHQEETSIDEIRLIDGTILDRYSAPVIGDKFEILGRIWVFRDVTEKKKNEWKIQHEHSIRTALIENSLDSIWAIDLNYRILYTNTAFKTIFKLYFNKEISDGINILECWTGDYRHKWQDRYERALSGERFVDVEEYNIVGSKCIFEISFNPMFVDKKIIGVSVRSQDITFRKQMEETIVQRKNELKLVIDNSKDYIYSIDKDYRLLTFNKGYEDFILKSYGLNLNVGDRAIFPQFGEGMLAVWKKHYDYVFSGYSIKFESVDKNEKLNTTRYFLNEINNIKNQEENIIAAVCIIRDITEQKEADRKILNATIEAEERERNYFARELHEGLGPILSAVKLYFQWLNKDDLKTPREELMTNIASIIEDAISTTKEISYKLSPHILSNFGVVFAIKSYIEKIQGRSDINFNFETNVESRLDNDVEITIYRIVNECINNTIKYASAKNVSINIFIQKNHISIKYNDDGKGFDLEAIQNSGKGLGLFNIKNRISILGGFFNLQTSEGKGVAISIKIPI